MQAVMKTGGQQFTINEGDEILVNLLDNAEVGSEITFNDVLLVVDGDNTVIGTPVVDGASITATVLEEVKGPKTRCVFFRRRKDSRTAKGHRQRYLKVKITGIKN